MLNRTMVVSGVARADDLHAACTIVAGLPQRAQQFVEDGSTFFEIEGGASDGLLTVLRGLLGSDWLVERAVNAAGKTGPRVS